MMVIEFLKLLLRLGPLGLPLLAVERAPDVMEPPAYEQFLVIPLRIHVLSSTDLPEIDCKLKDSDVERILLKVNGIWHKAGIHFGLESLVREPAARQGEFQAMRAQTEQAPLELFRMLRPEASRSVDGLHVYYVHRLPVNGVYLADGCAFVQETAALRGVEGGIDEPIPRVTSHELGHALGLPHRQDRTNLLASGTSGTLLNSVEVARARLMAGRIKGSNSVAGWRKAAGDAAEKGEVARAARIWGWLAAIPGDGAAEAKRQHEQAEARESNPNGASSK